MVSPKKSSLVYLSRKGIFFLGHPVHNLHYVEMFYLNSTLNFGIPPVLVFQLEVYYKVDRLLTGLTAQQKGTTARWYSNKTFLHKIWLNIQQFLILT